MPPPSQRRFTGVAELVESLLTLRVLDGEHHRPPPTSILVVGQGGGADAHGAYALAAALREHVVPPRGSCPGDRIFYATVKHKPFADHVFHVGGDNNGGEKPINPPAGDAADDADGGPRRARDQENANANDDYDDYLSAWRPDDDDASHVYLGGEVFEVKEDKSRTTLEHFVHGLPRQQQQHERNLDEEKKNEDNDMMSKINDVNSGGGGSSLRLRAKNVPAWVGTTWYEAAMPHRRMVTGATCPLVCNLALPLPKNHPRRRWSEKLCERQHRRLVTGLTQLAPPPPPPPAEGYEWEREVGSSDMKIPGADAVPGAGPGRQSCWDVVIGLDHGGDVFIGGEEGEDGRDVVMGDVLRDLVAAGGARRYLLAVHGLCVDGENYYPGMRLKLRDVLRSAGEDSFLGRYHLGDIERWLTPCVDGIMAPSKTPMIILSALNGALESAHAPPPARKVIMSDDDDVELSRRRRRVTVPRDVDGSTVTVMVAGDNDEEEEGTERCALTGESLKDFVVLPRRHFTDPATGTPAPAPVVPMRWVTTGYVFDGVAIGSYYRDVLGRAAAATATAAADTSSTFPSLCSPSAPDSVS